MAAELPGRLPTFKPEEIALAHDFIRSGLIKGEVRAGIPLETERSRRVLELNPAAGFWDRYPWMLKVDLVVETPAEVWIVELSSRIQMVTVGQILTYAGLYEEQYRPGKPIRLAVVARRGAPEVQAVLERQGVAVFIMPEV